jgi:hypothetical protein
VSAIKLSESTQRYPRMLIRIFFNPIMSRVALLVIYTLIAPQPLSRPQQARRHPMPPHHGPRHPLPDLRHHCRVWRRRRTSQRDSKRCHGRNGSFPLHLCTQLHIYHTWGVLNRARPLHREEQGIVKLIKTTQQNVLKAI